MGSPGQSSSAELLDLLLSTKDVEAFLDQLAQHAAGVVGVDVSCGITMARDGHSTTVVNTDTRASHLDEVQYGEDAGPCLHSMRTATVVSIPDLAATAGEWPSYRTRGILHGVRSSLSVPLTIDDTSVGAINLYASAAHAFGVEQVATAQRLADEASRALALALRLVHTTQINEHLQAAIVSRSVIDQAVGIIMGQNRCDAEQAFALLRNASQSRNVKLRQIATDMVISVGGRPPTKPPPIE